MWVIVLTLPILIRIFGPRVASYARERGILSQGELFGEFYKSRSLSVATGFIAIFAVLPFMVVQLSAIAKVVSIASNNYAPYSVTLIFFAVSTGWYLYFGGARAVVFTDAFQGICFLILLIVSATLFYTWVGGFGIALSKISQEAPHLLVLEGKRRALFIDNVLSWPFAFFLWPQLFQRMFMARNATEIKKSSFATFVLFGVSMGLIMTMGIMAAGTFIGNIMDPDILVAEMYKKYFPLGGAFIVLGVVASAMSTLDSGLLALSSVLCRDILKLEDGIDNAPRVARTSSIVLLVIVVIIALSNFGSGAMIPLVTLGASVATLLFWPLLGMTFFKKTDSFGVFLSYGMGILGIFLSVITTWLPFGPGTAGFIGGAIGFIFGCIIKTFIPKYKF